MTVLVLAFRYDDANGYRAKVRIEFGTSCSRCRTEIPAGEDAFFRETEDGRREVVHLRGRCTA